MTATVRLIAWTHFEPPGDVDWSTDAEGGQALAEFAGRACYQSWHKPNPATAAIKATVEKKSIRAPFAGRVGIRQVNVGQYVSPGMPLLPLQSLDQVTAGMLMSLYRLLRE